MADAAPGASRWTLFTGVVAGAGFLLGPLLARFGIISPMVGLALFALAGLLGLITLIGAFVTMIRRGMVSAGPALVVGLLVTGIFMAVALPGRGFPRINDITTDMTNPPEFVAVLTLPENQGRDMRYPGTAFASQQQEGYPDLAGLKLAAPPAEVFQRVVTAARQMPGWQILREDAAAHTLEGVATSSWFRFKDDFVIEVRPDNGGSRVEMRSKSRDGRGDIGANAARIRAFFAELQ